MASLVPVLAALQHALPELGAGYAGVGAAALLGWLGVPGIGEAVLIAASVEASRGRIGLAGVLLVAWAGATAGGIGGWLAGVHFGRRLALSGGWLRKHRERALAHGGVLLERYRLLAVFLTPSWVPGIHAMSARAYLPANAISALIWVLLLGLGAFAVGPQIGDVTDAIGYAGTAALAVLTLAGALLARRELRSRGQLAPER